MSIAPRRDLGAGIRSDQVEKEQQRNSAGGIHTGQRSATGLAGLELHENMVRPAIVWLTIYGACVTAQSPAPSPQIDTGSGGNAFVGKSPIWPQE